MAHLITDNFIDTIPATTRPWIILDAPHAAKPMADGWTEDITRAVAQATGAGALIATVSRLVVDLNRDRNDENAWAHDLHRQAMRQLLQDGGMLNEDGTLKGPVLHLAIHGMRDSHGTSIELGTAPFWGREPSCDPEVLNKVRGRTYEWATFTDAPVDPIDPWVNEHYYGYSVLGDHRLGDPDPAANYPGYGDDFHSIQIEINRTLRADHRGEVIDYLTFVAELFD